MHFTTFLLVTLVALITTSYAVPWECHVTHAREAADYAQELEEWNDSFNSNLKRPTVEPFNINVFWHVVIQPSAYATPTGNLSQETLDRQLQVLNSDFGPYDISFTQAGADWTESPSAGYNASESVMKMALHKGSYTDVNIYFVPFVAGPDMTQLYFGNAQLPGSIDFDTEEFLLDGIVIDQTLSASFYDEGHAATHQVGHWLGLFHISHHGCDQPGDYIHDTPATRHSHFSDEECDILVDTCPDDVGSDPVKNFMGISGDDCWSEFTEGQAIRMHQMWHKFRARDVSDDSE